MLYFLQSGFLAILHLISNGFLITHRIQQNGVNGTETYYLELENLDNPKPKCISLTDEEVCDMVEKINSITC